MRTAMYSSDPPPRPAAQKPSAAVRWLAVVLLLVAGALVFAVMQKRDQQTKRVSQPQVTAPVAAPAPVAPRPPTPPGSFTNDETQTIDLFEQTSPSVVHVTSIATRRERFSMNVLEIPQGTGTGFIWDEHGHVVTNFHVIVNGQTAQVTLSDNSVWPAKIVGRAPDKDLALLQIDAPADKLRAIPLGTSNDLKVGQKVLAIGNPFGFDQTLTTGVISGLNREIQSMTQRPIQGVIQTDAAINPGNSGGPLLDSSGRLIGVNTAIFSPSGAYAGIGFAVPVDTVNRIVPQLVEHGRVVRPGLGINIVQDEVARRFHVEGVVVMDAPDGTVAEHAGIRGLTRGLDGGWRLGDVITGIDHFTIKNSGDLYRELDKRQVGDKVTLELLNDGEKRTIELVLQAMPD